MHGGAKQHTKANAAGDRHQELRLDAAFDDQRKHAEEGCHRRQHDRPEARFCTVDDGQARRFAVGSFFIDEVDHHQGAIHNHTGEADDAKDSRKGEVDAKQQVTKDCADRPKGVAA